MLLLTTYAHKCSICHMAIGFALCKSATRAEKWFEALQVSSFEVCRLSTSPEGLRANYLQPILAITSEILPDYTSKVSESNTGVVVGQSLKPCPTFTKMKNLCPSKP